MERRGRSSSASRVTRFSGVDFADAQHGWVVGSGGAIRYSRGRRRHVDEAGERHDRVFRSYIDATGGGSAWAMGFAVTRQSGASVLVRTTDAGAHWLPVALPTKFFPIVLQRPERG